MLVILMKMTVSSLDKINLSPANEAEEIAQNVLMIIATPKGSVPYQRGFGVNGKFIDMPMLAIKAKIAGDIARQIKKYEPRAKFLNANFFGELDGKLNIKVEFEIVSSV